MANAWLAHLKAFRKKNPKMSLKQAMKAASSSYKKSAGKKSGAKKKKAKK